MGNSPIELDAGVIITDTPYQIDKNFTGLIICNGKMTVSGNVSIQACEELSGLLFTYIPSLQDVLGPSFNKIGVAEDGTVVDVSALKYTDIVDKSNWQKD